MKKLVLRIVFLALFSSCGDNKGPLAFGTNAVSGGNEIKTEADPAFENIQAKVVNISCLKCHGPNQKKHTDLTSKAVFLQNYDDIIYRMTDAFEVGIDNMPPKGNPVAPELINEIKLWKADNEFSSLQKTLFVVSCLKCHGPNQTKHANLTSKAVVLEKFDDIIYRMTDAFEADDEPMPPVGKGSIVSPELIKELKKWKASL